MPREVAIVGVGYSTIARNTDLSVSRLGAEAVLAALDDAGLTPRDVNGFCSHGSEPLREAWSMGITPLDWFSSAQLAPAFSFSAIQAIAAIRSGMCDTAVALRVIKRRPTGDDRRLGGGPAADADSSFKAPFGGGSPSQWAGLFTQRYFQEFNAGEECLAARAVAQREYATLNEDALLREPLTAEGYFASRYISRPVRVLDCDYPCDAGSAVIFTTAERARDTRKRPVLVESEALTAIRDLNFETVSDMTRTAPWHCAEALWSRTDLTPADIDVAQLYDGFSIIVIQWLEALGICELGGAADFILSGQTATGGVLPVNTDGGACNVGRRHGANFCIEATRQIRGECGTRQVANAEVAVWTNAIGPFAGAVLLTRG
jgi:acetyl-CoA acetyltransferase